MIANLPHELTYAATVGGYLTFLIFGLALWLFSRRSHSKIASVGQMIERIMHHRTTRVAIMIAWWWVGFHFLVNVIHR